MARKIKLNSFLFFFFRIKRIQHVSKKILFLPKETRYLPWKKNFIFLIIIILYKNCSYNLQLFVDEILKGSYTHFYDFSRNSDPSLFSISLSLRPNK